MSLHYTLFFCRFQLRQRIISGSGRKQHVTAAEIAAAGYFSVGSAIEVSAESDTSGG